MEQEAGGSPVRKKSVTDVLKVPASIAKLNDTKKSYGCGFCLILQVVRSIAMVIVGSVYINDCVTKQMIPIYLIVAGCLGVLGEALMGYTRYYHHTQHDISNVLKILNGILPTVSFIWFIGGAIVVYSLPDANRHPPFCNRFLYLFTFWMITLSIIILGVSLFFLCCCAACFAIFALVKSNSEGGVGQQQQEQQEPLQSPQQSQSPVKAQV